jgi:hypothetical protein
MLRLETAALVSSTACLLLGGVPACGNCTRAESTVQVVFNASIVPDEVTSLVATGACGPAPAVCTSGPGVACDAAMPGVWGVSVPTVSAGTCQIHVSLADGEVFDGTVMVKNGSCGGYFPVDVVSVPFGAGNDAGAGD